MNPTQHPTILRRSHARSPHMQGIEITHDDVLAAIAQIAQGQQTHYVMIALLSVTLGIGADDRAWLLHAIHELDLAGRVMLSPVEKLQSLALYQACWFVSNASGIPCHEVCLAPDSQRLKPLLQQHAPTLPLFARATDGSTHNPTMQRCRVSALVESAAKTLFGCGHSPHTQVRVLETSTGRAA
jgi:hypothetical protein